MTAHVKAEQAGPADHPCQRCVHLLAYRVGRRGPWKPACKVLPAIQTPCKYLTPEPAVMITVQLKMTGAEFDEFVGQIRVAFRNMN